MKRIHLLLAALLLLIGCSTTRKSKIIEPSPELNFEETFNDVFETEGDVTLQEPQEEFAVEPSVLDNSDLEQAEETQATIVEQRLFNLGKNPGQNTINTFNSSLVKCFNTARQELDEDDYYDKGLTYMVAPRGVVSPFSKTEVQCISGSPYAENIGRDFCDKFFECLGMQK